MFRNRHVSQHADINMFLNRDSAWIGFQEAQKTIHALKEEVQIAEKKLTDVKKTLNFDKKIVQNPMFNKNSSLGHGKKHATKLNDRKHFFKETMFRKLPQKEKMINKQNFKHKRNHRKSHLHSKEDSPNSSPCKISFNNADKIHSILAKSISSSALFKVSSSDASSPLLHQSNESISSDGTSSLIAATYKDIDSKLTQVILKCEAMNVSSNSLTSEGKEFLDRESTCTEIENSSKDALIYSPLETTPKGLDENTTFKTNIVHSGISPPSAQNFTNDLEWIPISNGRIPLRHPRTNSALKKLRNVINQQKKLQDEFETRTKVSTTFNGDKDVGQQKNEDDQESNFMVLVDKKNDALLKPFIRKTCTVSAVPKYKGFNIPSSNLSRERVAKLNKKFENGLKMKEPLRRITISVTNNENNSKKSKQISKNKEEIYQDTPERKEIDEEKNFITSSSEKSSESKSLCDDNNSNKSTKEPLLKTGEKDDLPNNKNIYVDNIFDSENEEEQEENSNPKKENLKPTYSKSVKRKAPKVSGKRKKDDSLKHIMKSIAELSEPFEHFMQTKKWVEESPPPPAHKEKRNFSSSSEKLSDSNYNVPETNTNFIVDVAKSLQKIDNNSFQRQVADVGDTSQLFEKILGKHSYHSLPRADPNSSILKNSILQSDKEISLTEKSLKSDKDNGKDEKNSPLRSVSTPTSTFKSELTVLEQNPDPFNFINTWNRKPLDIPVIRKNFLAESLSSEASTQSQESIEKYESPIHVSRSINSHYKTSSESRSQLFSNQTLYSSDFSEVDSSPKRKTNYSVVQDNPNTSVLDTSVFDLVSGSLTESQISLISGTLITEDSDTEKIKDSKKNIRSPNALPQAESSISEMISVVENSATENSSMSDAKNLKQFSDEGNSKSKSGENTSISLTSFSRKQPVSDPFPDDFSLEDHSKNIDLLKNQENESKNESSFDLKKSAESIPTVFESNPSVASELPNSETSESQSVVKDDTSLQIETVQESLPEKEFSHLSVKSLPDTDGSERIPDDQNIALQENTVESFSGVSSPSSLTIDFTQPVKFAVANNFAKSLKVHKKHPIQEKHYFPSHVVTRVAAEAAAAAVAAVVSSQKELLSLQSQKLTTTQIKESMQTICSSSQRNNSHHSSASSSKSDSSDETIVDVASEGNSPDGEIKEAIDYADEQHEFHSLQSSSNKASTTTSEEIPTDKNIKSREAMHKRKISGNFSSPSPASLSENESISSVTLVSSHSSLSDITASGSVHSDDSFAQLTLDVVRRMTHEEESRARHQLSLLRMQEKTLVDKARDQMTLLEVLKKKLKEKGADKRKVSIIKKSQKDLIFRLRQERAQLRCMQEAYRSVCEKHQSMLADKYKLLNEPSSLAYQILNRKEKILGSKISRDLKPSVSSSNAAISLEKDLPMVEDVLEELDISNSVTSISPHESARETEVSGHSKSSVSSQNNSIKTSVSTTFLSKQPSMNSVATNFSNEQAAQGFKKLEASKRHLTKREQRIFQRRKNVEKLLQWQMKLDNEEMAVRELELKAVELVDSNKKKTKYYISSSSSLAPDASENKRSTDETDKNYTTQSSTHESISSEKIVSEVDSNGTVRESGQSDSIPEENLTIVNLSGASEITLEEKLTEKDSNDSKQSFSSVPETEIVDSNLSSIKSSSEINGNSLVKEISTNVSSSIVKSPSSKLSSGLENYSESFDSSPSQKAISSTKSSSDMKISTTTENVKKDKGFNIRSPLIPRSIRRHDSSGSDDSYTISHSETASDQSDIEGRIHALAEQLRRRKAEAEKLKRDHKKKYREKLKEKELSLQKQLEAYNQYIEQTKKELESQVESVSSQNSEISAVKPQIKWPRPENASDSRQLRKRASVPVDSFTLESKKSIDNNAPDSIESASVLSNKDKDVVSKLFTNNESKSQKIALIKPVSSEKDQPHFIKSDVETSSVSSVEISNEMHYEIKSKIVTDFKKNSETESSALSKSEKLEEMESRDSSAISVVTDESIPERDASASETESKSSYPSDSFVSDSSYSKSDYESKSKDNENLSMKSFKDSVSSGEEVNSTHFSDHSGESQEELEKSRHSDSSPKVEDEPDSEIEYVSEASSLTLSVKENDSMKCETSDGCHRLPTKFSDNKNKDKCLLISETFPDVVLKKNSSQELCNSVSDIKDPKQIKSSPSDTFITSIVNNVYCNIFEDSLRTISNILLNYYSRQKLKPSGESNLQLKKTAIGYSDLKDLKREKCVEIISSELFNHYLQDSIVAILKIAASFKKSSRYENVTLREFRTQDFTVITNSVDSTHSSDASKVHPGDSREQKQITLNQSHDSEANIFKKEIDWYDDGFMSLQSEQQIEQQMLIQQYPFYYRKIPNKPPPPYTLPAASFSAPTAYQLALKQEKPTIQIDPITHVTKNIYFIVEYITNLLITEKEKGCMINEINDPNFNPIIEKLELVIPCQLTFLELIFDAAKEIVLDIYDEKKEIQKPWLKPKRLTPKPLFPCDESKVFPTLLTEIKKTFKLLPKDQVSAWQRKRPTWSTLKLGRKKRDFVDTILISEIKNEEPDWINYDQDEVTVKFQIADSILDLLLDDTIRTIKKL